MKKVLAFITSISMLVMLTFPLTGFAMAEQKVKLTDAIEIAKKTLNITTDNFNFNYNYNENKDVRSTWELNWNAKNNIDGNINVSVDSETGDIINYFSWQPSDNQPLSRIPKYSKSSAKDEAIKFVSQVQPLKFKEMIFQENPVSIYDMPMNSDTYSFRFTRQLNGIDFPDNGINIAIDKNTLKIRSYNFNWDNGPFTEPAKAIGLDAATKVFADKLGIGLSYNLIYDQKSGSPQNAILVYALKNGSYSIDAVTGDIINYNGPVYSARNDMALKAAAGSSVVITPQEQKSIDASSNYVSKEKALEEAQKYVTPDTSAKLTYSSLYNNSYDGSAAWNFSWNGNDPDKRTYSYYNAQVDAVTGKIKSFSMDGSSLYPDKDVPVSYTQEQAKQIAEKFISTLEPEKFTRTKYQEVPNYNGPNPDKVNQYYLNYVGNINGAICNFDSFNVSVNAYTGKVMSYSMNWMDKLVLPSADKAMNLDAAYKVLYSKAKLNLKYVKYYDYTKGNAIPQVKLAYVLDDFSGFIDANTGTFLDYSGQPVKENKSLSFDDIKGNAAENDINILADMGIIDNQTGKFNPDGLVLQKDFIKMLVRTIAPTYAYRAVGTSDNDEYDFYYDQAIQKNIISKEQKNPDSNVTRQDAAKMIVRAMGIGYLAELSSMYNMEFKDSQAIPNNLKGYAVIVNTLNIITSPDGMFNGTNNISRGQTATFIVNYLKVDTNIK